LLLYPCPCPNPSPSLTPNPKPNVFGDYEYLFVKEGLSQDEHKKKAVEWGGHLASIHSAEENDFLKGRLAFYGFLNAWLGGKRFDGEETGDAGNT